ncbi:MAG: HutP family protein, partial [Clostridia bacterium]
MDVRQEPVIGSRDVARAALILCMSRTREEERALKTSFLAEGVLTAAVDYGGE